MYKKASDGKCKYDCDLIENDMTTNTDKSIWTIYSYTDLLKEKLCLERKPEKLPEEKRLSSRMRNIRLGLMKTLLILEDDN